MSEKALADRVMKILKPLHGIRVENPCLPGTPDVNYVNGWIELKQHDRWPKNIDIPLKLGHDLMPQQRIWLRKRIERGGKAFVLLQVARDYILLDGLVASEILGFASEREIKANAIFCVQSRDLPDALLEAL